MVDCVKRTRPHVVCLGRKRDQVWFSGNVQSLRNEIKKEKRWSGVTSTFTEQSHYLALTARRYGFLGWLVEVWRPALFLATAVFHV